MKKENLPKFNIPIRGNQKLEKLISRVKRDKTLNTLLRMSNINAIDRMGYSDHGPVHIKIVANLALEILRILTRKRVKPSVVENYGLKNEDAEIVVVLGAILHDIGMGIHRQGHEILSTLFASSFIDYLIRDIYKNEEERTIIKYETLQTIYSHRSGIKPLTIEAGIVKVADALDMEKGRARIPYQIGMINIHSVSALAIEKVKILEGKEKPLKIIILMSNPAGIFQVDELLKEKIINSGIEKMLEIEARITKEGKEEIFKKY
jgi:metal-dependent HD superfamily phosphatase/phosphodiesterase